MFNPPSPLRPHATVTMTHLYTSTACGHDLHPRCRQACKYCGEPCLCPCHGDEALARQAAASRPPRYA